MFVHNGVIAGFEAMRRDLMLAVDPSLFTGIRGSTDSEVLFHLTLTFGLQDDPVLALERAIGFVEQTAARHHIAAPVQASIGVTDGNRLWALRYASRGRPRSLFASADASAIHALYPANEQLQRLRDEDRVVVSEPLADLPGMWDEIPRVERARRPAGPGRASPVPPTSGAGDHDPAVSRSSRSSLLGPCSRLQPAARLGDLDFDHLAVGGVRRGGADRLVVVARALASSVVQSPSYVRQRRALRRRPRGAKPAAAAMDASGR